MIIQGCLIILLTIALKMLLKRLGDREAFGISADVWDLVDIFTYNLGICTGIIFIGGGALSAMFQ